MTQQTFYTLLVGLAILAYWLNWHSMVACRAQYCFRTREQLALVASRSLLHRTIYWLAAPVLQPIIASYNILRGNK